MQINNNSQTSFGFFDVKPKAILNCAPETLAAIKTVEKEVGSLKDAGVVIFPNGMPCVESTKGHKFCAPFRAEITNNKITVYAVDDNPATRLFNGAEGNITLNFPDKAAALKAYKEINSGTTLDAAAAFAKHLDATL